MSDESDESNDKIKEVLVEIDKTKDTVNKGIQLGKN